MKVVIIGAGVAGLGLGWRLRQAGLDVVVLERAQPARGASWAAAGMIAPSGELTRSHRAEAEFGLCSSRLWPSFAGEVEQESGMAIGYRQNGALFIARTRDEARAQQSATMGEAITAEDARRRVPLLTGDIVAAQWVASEAQVDNRALGQALENAFIKRGGELAIHEPAVRFDVTADRVIGVRTPFRMLEADLYVIAAGAWSSRFEGLPPDVLPAIKPVKGQMMSVRPPLPTDLPAEVIWGNEIYLVARQGQLLIGATMEPDAGFDTRVTDIAMQWLSGRAISLVPKLAVWDVIERWAGLRPASADGLPVLGQTGLDNVMIASGQFRNGILMAPALAQSMTNLIINGSAPEIADFDPRR